MERRKGTSGMIYSCTVDYAQALNYGT